MISKDIRIISACNQEWEGQTHCDNLSFSGVGKINAALHTAIIIRVHKPKLIINYGTGASKHFWGKLVDCNKFIQGDMNVEELGFQKGVTPYEDDIPMMMDFSQSDIINPLTYGLTCYTADKFRTPSQYEDVIDMEAYAIAKVCYLHNVDFISYKYITDDGSADDWISNCHKGTEQFKEVLKDYEE